MEREVLPFKTVIQELLAGQDLLVDPLVPAVIEAWGRVIPESLRQGICLEGIREGTLCLSVSNPAAGQQFQFLKDFVRDKINEILGKPVVQGFRMKPGSPPTVRQKDKTESRIPKFAGRFGRPCRRAGVLNPTRFQNLFAVNPRFPVNRKRGEDF
jgi:hypothetical protein